MMQMLERLRLAREAHGLDVQALARRTRLRAHLLEAVEAGRWADLPRGVYARAVVRAYAEAVGLDPNRVITEVAPLLPVPEDPIDGIARVHGYERQAPDPPQAPVPAAGADATLDLRPRLHEAAVAAIDGIVLVGFTAKMAAATAWLCGVSVAGLAEVAGPAILVQAGLAAAFYFVVLGGIGGATLGARLVRGRPRRSFRGDLAAAAREGSRLALEEASILVSVFSPPAGRAPAADRREAPRSGTPWAGPAAAR